VRKQEKQKYVPRSEAVSFPDIQLKSQNNSGDSLIHGLMRFCANVSLITKLADHIRRCASVKGHNVSMSKTVMHPSYQLYFMLMVTKHAE
jgi:hypothetical protein